MSKLFISYISRKVQFLNKGNEEAKTRLRRIVDNFFNMASQLDCRCVWRGLVWSALFYVSFLLTAPGMLNFPLTSSIFQSVDLNSGKFDEVTITKPETGIVRGLQNKLNVAYVIVSAF